MIGSQYIFQLDYLLVTTIGPGVVTGPGNQAETDKVFLLLLFIILSYTFEHSFLLGGLLVHPDHPDM